MLSGRGYGGNASDFSEELDEHIDAPDAHVVEAINAGLEFRHHVRYVSASCQMEVRELSGL